MSPEERKSWVDRGLKDPVKAYRQHAVNAGQRGIPFEMTFAQWWAIWEPHYEQRGRSKGQMVMCRTGDQGGYSAGNVRVDTSQSNAREAKEVRQAETRAVSDVSWMHQRFNYGMDYFRSRIREEERAEAGLDEDED